MRIAPGTIFGSDFRVERPLAAGAMGEVYIAEQLSTGKQRALKVMSVTFVADERLRQMFDQEARVGGRIDSEHVVEVVAAGIDASSATPWLAMELLRGEDLTRRIAKGPLRDGELLTLFEQVCHAMGAAHRAGVVHRDLKPDNVFLAEAKRARLDYTVKILDFGIAKMIAAGRQASTDAAGTPLWMAPEQTRPGPLDARADVWALGLIAFYALTGRHYWRAGEDDAATPADVLREITEEPLVFASRRARDHKVEAPLPQGFDEWFARCVNRDIDQRFADADELWMGLSKLLSVTPAAQLALAATVRIGGRPLADSPDLRGAEGAGRRRSRRGLAIGGAALFGSALLGYVGWRQLSHAALPLTTIQLKSGRYYLTANHRGGVARTTGVLSTDADTVSATERFVLVPEGPAASHLFAIRTPSGDYLQAVNGGGSAGPADPVAALRTDAKQVGPEDGFRVTVVGWDRTGTGCRSYPGDYPRGCPVVTLRTPDGVHYLSASLDPNGRYDQSPISAGVLGVSGWETFRFGDFGMD